jgi:hypothetical protein
MSKNSSLETGGSLGDPDVPEERNPNGHDSRPNRSGVSEPKPAGTGAAPLQAAEIPKVRTPTKVEDAKFLADEFDIPQPSAAEAVAREDISESRVASLAAEVHRQRAKDDSLAGVPPPRGPAADLTSGADETALKPVLHCSNLRTGTG